jgi:propionyl-CoA synthetase
MSAPTWFSRPSDAAAGTLNVVYDALDRQIIGGYADAPAVVTAGDEVSYAVLLEQVAAFGGLLRALGVRTGDAVAVTATTSPESVVAVLAAARIGAVPWVGETPDGLVARSDTPLIVADGAQMAVVAPAVDALDPQRPRAVVVVRPGEWTLVETRDVAWEPALKAGATDPAAVVPVAPDTSLVVADDGGTSTHGDLTRTSADSLAAGAPWTVEGVRAVVSALTAGRAVTLAP